MQKIVLIVLIGLIALFQYSYLKGKNGKQDKLVLINKIKGQEVINNQLLARNESAILRLEELKGNQNLLEMRARYELNLIKPNELFLSFPKPNFLNSIVESNVRNRNQSSN